jgi:hypothetical protein
VLFWSTSNRQSAAVVWLVQVLTSLAVAPSLATILILIDEAIRVTVGRKTINSGS